MTISPLLFSATPDLIGTRPTRPGDGFKPTYGKRLTATEMAETKRAAVDSFLAQTTGQIKGIILESFSPRSKGLPSLTTAEDEAFQRLSEDGAKYAFASFNQRIAPLVQSRSNPLNLCRIITDSPSEPTVQRLLPKTLIAMARELKEMKVDITGPDIAQFNAQITAFVLDVYKATQSDR